MDKNKAVGILQDIISNLDDSASLGEEIDWALAQDGRTRKDLDEAFRYLSWVDDTPEIDRMGL